MKRFQRIRTAFVIVAMLLSFVSCSSKNNADINVPATITTVPGGNNTIIPDMSEQTSNDDTIMPDAAEQTSSGDTVTPDTAESYIVVLPDGTELFFNSVPQRIISMGPNITEILYAIGAGDKLVGRTDYCDYPSDALLVESVGNLYSPDIEKIIELQPDIIIGSIHFYGEAKEQLENLGIQTAVLYECDNLDGIYDTIRAAGQISGYADKADALAVQTQEEIENIKRTAALNSVKPSVYYVVGYGEYGDYTAGGDTFIGQMLEAAGGNNIAAGINGWSYSLEALLEADPDIIILGLGEAEAFKTAENYRELSAVKNGRVMEIDRNLLDRQGYRNAEGLKKLAEILQPALLKE